MNLYKITVGHEEESQFHKAMVCLLLAENDEAVYNWLKKEPIIEGEAIMNSWEETEISDAAFKQRMIDIKGEINERGAMFTEWELGEVYYGWESLGEVQGEGPEILREAGILFKA